MAFTLKFLGTGTSVGVPQIGCSCATCMSSDPRDKRRRSGAWVTDGETAFLIDTPPEMRLACIEYGIAKVDAIVLTHAHMDHVAGFDDVRRFNTLNGTTGPDGKVVGRPMPCYGSPETIEAMHRLFPYISDKPNDKGLFRPMIVFTPVDGAFSVGGFSLTPLPVEHGPCTNGYVVERDGARLAYVSDCCEIPESTLSLMGGLDVLVLNCLRERFHPTHLNLEKSISYVERLKPRRTFFIHMCHDVKHEEFESRLSPSVRLAYDGLEVKL